MDDRTIRDWSERLDRERETLADPFPALWHRVGQPRLPWLPAGLGLAGAAALLVVGWGWSALANQPAEAGWNTIVDDLWAIPQGATPIDANWEIGSGEWNLLDLGGDQGA
jgi:hypothetical protein